MNVLMVHWKLNWSIHRSIVEVLFQTCFLSFLDRQTDRQTDMRCTEWQIEKVKWDGGWGWSLLTSHFTRTIGPTGGYSTQPRPASCPTASTVAFLATAVPASHGLVHGVVNWLSIYTPQNNTWLFTDDQIDASKKENKNELNRKQKKKKFYKKKNKLWLYIRVWSDEGNIYDYLYMWICYDMIRCDVC